MNSEQGERRLREDADPYCMLWIAMLVFATYYFNFYYNQYIQSTFISSLGANFLPLSGLPLLLVFLFLGYFKPKRKGVKINMLTLSIVFSLIYAVIALPIGGIYLASWGISGSILVALAISMRHSYEEATTPGIMDIHSLQYGPPKESAETPAEPAE